MLFGLENNVVDVVCLLLFGIPGELVVFIVFVEKFDWLIFMDGSRDKLLIVICQHDISFFHHI